MSDSIWEPELSLESMWVFLFEQLLEQSTCLMKMDLGKFGDSMQTIVTYFGND